MPTPKVSFEGEATRGGGDAFEGCEDLPVVSAQEMSMQMNNGGGGYGEDFSDEMPTPQKSKSNSFDPRPDLNDAEQAVWDNMVKEEMAKMEHDMQHQVSREMKESEGRAMLALSQDRQNTDTDATDRPISAEGPALYRQDGKIGTYAPAGQALLDGRIDHTLVRAYMELI